MAEKSTPPENEAVASDVRGQLIKRLAVAGGLVAILLGVLAVFDRLASNNGDDVESPVFTQPVPVAPKKEITQPVTPANLPEPPAQEPPPPAPQVETPVPEAEKKVEKKTESKQEIRTPARSTATVVNPPAVSAPEGGPRQHPLPAAVQRTPAALAESSAAPAIAPNQPVAEERLIAKPAARIVEARSNPPSTPASNAQHLFSGFLLQAGVFSSAQRAEELHARLTLSGVPSTLETRVQVGPFRTRREAEAAQEKLKQLGVESLLVPPKGVRN